LKKQVVDLKKALTNEQTTVAKLRASLKEVGFYMRVFTDLNRQVYKIALSKPANK